MTTRDEVLNALLTSDEAISGERLAMKLGISRNSVWKAIEQLRLDGYDICATTNRGYRLATAPNLISEPEIKCALRTQAIGAQMEVHALLDSTNTRAKQAAGQGAPHGYLVCADSQTAGRGRFGRVFYSPKHAGIYMTYVLRPKLPAERAVLITSMAAVAVARAIEALADVDVKIKWVNDLYIHDRKVCGILCEASLDVESAQLEYVALGIGVNVLKAEIPDELKDIVISIEDACGKAVSRSRLIAEISNQLEALYPSLTSGAFIDEYRARSNVIGRDVTVLRGNDRYPARVLGIDDRCALVVRTEAGEAHIGAGEISLKLR